MSSPKAAAPKPSAKRTLLRDITGDAASKHNVDAQQQEAHGSAKPSGQDMNYFQRQYHSALMSSAIEEHRRYLAQHPEVDAPADNRPIQQPQPNPRRRVAQAPQQRRAGPVHEDVDGYPCPCPDCNMRRYEEAMLEHMPQQHHVPAEPQYEYYGMPAAPVQQVAAHPTGRRSPRQHSPYSFQPVGYSPDNGFYGMTSFPNSPLQPAAAEFAPSFDVPYIPAQHDYTRYAMADENNNTDSSDAAAEEPSGRPSVAEQPPRATRDRSRRPKAEKSPESPQRPRAPQQRNAREERPKKASAPTAAIEPRPACPFALQLRVSRWHTKSVVSPTPYAEGAFVIFEGDRGRDCGEVLSCQAAKEEVNARTPPPAMALALASQDDVATHRQNERDAAATVETAIAASDKLKLRMKIVGAVYQHDRAKLTFMYESGERVDFRQLLRDLYGEFRCRIWMEVPSQK